MGCFCKSMLPQLQAAMAQLAVPAGTPVPGIQPVAALSAWLGARGLPSVPWSPNPAWEQASLPAVPLSPASMATVGALANLRAQALAQFGLDLLQPTQAAMFARVSATLSARVAAAGAEIHPESSTARWDAEGGEPAASGPGWVQLASANFAIDQVRQALGAGVFTADPEAYAVPAPMQGFVTRLSAIAPLVAVNAQLGIDSTGNFAPPLASAMRTLLAMPLPMPAAAALAAMTRLSAQLAAVASLQASLGTAPLEAGLTATQQGVAAKLATLQPALAEAGLTPGPAAAGGLPASLPAMPYCPAALATPAVVQAALSMNPASVAALTWRAPPIADVAQLQAGLPTVSLAAQMKAALGITAAGSPCLAGCDGAAVLRTAVAA